MPFLQLIAQETTDKATNTSSPIPSMIMFGLIGLAMYFLLIRPQRRRMREAQELVRKIAEGDEVITSGGIYGFISAIDGDVFWLDIADGVEIRVHRSAITRRIDPAQEPAGGEPAPGAGTDGDDDDSKNSKKK